MKRKILILFLLGYAFCFPLRKAFVANAGYSLSREIPAPPRKGRKNERKSYSWINRPARTYTYWMGKGKRYLAKREYEQAIWAFRKASKLRPASEISRFMLAFTYEKRALEGLPADLTNWESLAENEYKSAIFIADYLPARYNLALLYKRNGKIAAAQKELEHILTISPSGKIGNLAKSMLVKVIELDYKPRSMSIKFPGDAKW